MNPIPANDPACSRPRGTTRRGHWLALMTSVVLAVSALPLQAEWPYFNEPQEWEIQGVDDPNGHDPLNVILSAESNISLEQAIQAMAGTVQAGWGQKCKRFAGGKPDPNDPGGNLTCLEWEEVPEPLY